MNRVKPVFVLLTIGIAVAGCGPAAHVAESPATTATASPSPTPTVTVPTESQLKSGLLTAAEIGAPYKAETASGTSNARIGGCEALANLMNDTSTNPGEVTATADFTAGESGPFVTQALTAEPVSSFERSLKTVTDALASCAHLTVSEDGTSLSFELTPIHFAEGATAKRIDGTYQGIPLNGYLAVERISRNVAMVFFYFQIGSGSSQDAYRVYTLAADKAMRVFPS